ncbi:MAG: CxxC-x17-CxxC domain-containing protein [Candidatus Omnitrophota bacterium]
MTKRTKAKKSKKFSATKTELPDLVTIMTKLVERLETLERKTDQTISRIMALPTEVRRAIQDLQLPQAPYSAQSAPRPEQTPYPSHGQRERILYQAVCADCCKRCEVPFKPSGDRPVYCPECFAIRKAGHVPKDLTSHVVVPHHLRTLKTAPGREAKEATRTSKSKRPRSAKSGKKSAPKASGKKKKRSK